VDEINAKCKSLSASRKARRQAAEKASTAKEAVATLGESSKTLSPHKADKSTAVTCVAVKSLSSKPDGWVLSGSTDKTAILSSLESGKVVAKLAGHSKKVTAVAFVDPFHINSAAEADLFLDCATVFTASADKSVKVHCAHCTHCAH
jgi:WD40 repeat protein